MNYAKKRLGAVDPFLKWPGGKRWLAPLLANIIDRELLGTYFEPFVGAAAVFLQLRQKRAVLSDINAELIHCLREVKADPESVLRAVWRYTNTRECYYRARCSRPRTAIGAAARLIYLNRTCWGGIYRLNQNGEFNVPFGGHDRVICHKGALLAVAGLLRRATLRCADFEEVMAEAGRGDVIYADPPYTTRGEDNGFLRYNEQLFSWADQKRLAAAARLAAKRGAFVAVSALWQRDLLGLYGRWWAWKLQRWSRVAGTIDSRRIVSEVVLFSRKPCFFGSANGCPAVRL